MFGDQKKSIPKLLLFASCVVFMVMIIPLFGNSSKAYAADVLFHTSCGYSAEFDLYDNGELRIYGSGKITSTNFSNITEHFDKLIIGEGITGIGDLVFSDCDNLKSVKLPNSMTSIGSYAFSDCKRMTSINLPDNIDTIKTGAFSGCGALTKITLPAKLTLLEEFAFNRCDSLKTVVMGSNITRIEDYPFGSCGMLTCIHFKGTASQWDQITNAYNVLDLNNASVEYNHSNSWNAGVITKSPTCTATGTKKMTCKVCGATKTVTVPKKAHTWGTVKLIKKPTTSVKGKKRSTCSICGGTKTETITTYHEYKNGVLTVYGKIPNYGIPPWQKYSNKATKIVVGEGVTKIGSNAFADFKKTTIVKLPKSLKTIDGSAFDNVPIKSFKLPNKTVRIRYNELTCPSNTFSKYIVPAGHKYYSSYKGVLLNKKKTIVYDYPVNKKGQTFKVPTTVTTLDDNAFDNSRNLKKIILSKRTTTLGQFVFGPKLRTLVIKSTNMTEKTIAEYAFNSCSSNLKIDVPNSKIKEYTTLFRSCGLSKKAKIY